MKCKACGAEGSGSYCSNCGERLSSPKETGEKVNDPRDKSVKVADQRTEHSAQRGTPKRKADLKTVLCCPIGFFIGLFSDNPIEFLLLFGLFAAYILLPD